MRNFFHKGLSCEQLLSGSLRLCNVLSLKLTKRLPGVRIVCSGIVGDKERICDYEKSAPFFLYFVSMQDERWQPYPHANIKGKISLTTKEILAHPAHRTIESKYHFFANPVPLSATNSSVRQITDCVGSEPADIAWYAAEFGGFIVEKSVLHRSQRHCEHHVEFSARFRIPRATGFNDLNIINGWNSTIGLFHQFLLSRYSLVASSHPDLISNDHNIRSLFNQGQQKIGISAVILSPKSYD